jgi:hypothetical protein
MRLRTLCFVLVPFLCALTVVNVEAQVLTGNIIGLVYDESHAVLPGVSVGAESPARPGGPAVTVTNAEGEYRLIELPPGVYEITVSLSGFRTYKEQDLRVTVGGTIERNITLGVGGMFHLMAPALMYRV